MGEVLAMTRGGGDPQLENGYLKLANELVEAICKTHLSPNESQVLWFIIRKTYGYNKKVARISGAQYEEGTGINRTHVYRTIRKLIERNIVTKGGHSGSARIGIQKNYKKWKRVTGLGLSDQSRSQLVTKVGHSLPIISKRQYKDKEGLWKKCIHCSQLFQPLEDWHKSCSQCYLNPPQRAPIPGDPVKPCTSCGWQPGPGYPGMDENNVCLDCRQKEE